MTTWTQLGIREWTSRSEGTGFSGHLLIVVLTSGLPAPSLPITDTKRESRRLTSSLRSGVTFLHSALPIPTDLGLARHTRTRTTQPSSSSTSTTSTLPCAPSSKARYEVDSSDPKTKASSSLSIHQVPTPAVRWTGDKPP